MFLIFTIHAVLTAEQIETERQDLEEAGQEEICLDNPEVDPEDATMFTCVEECPNAENFFEPAGIDNVCYGETRNVHDHLCCFLNRYVCDSLKLNIHTLYLCSSQQQ